MKAFIINLPKDKGRKNHMSKMLGHYGIEYEFVEALYGKDVSEEFISKIYDGRKSIEVNGQDLSKAEIGCAYSHTMVYKRIIEQNLDYALVLEDDVHFGSGILDIIAKVENTNNKDLQHPNANLKLRSASDYTFDWLQIDYIQPGYFFFSHWLMLAKVDYKFIFKFLYIALLSLWEGARNNFYNTFNFLLKILSKKLHTKNVKLISITKFHRPLYLASAYIVTNEAAHKLLSVNTPVFLAADRLQNYLSWERRNDIEHESSPLIVKAVVPLMARQRRDIFTSNLEEFTNNTKEYK